MDSSARQWGFEIRVFPLLGELPKRQRLLQKQKQKQKLPKAIEPHLPVCQLYRWQLGPNMWSSPTTKSFDPIVVTALQVGFPRESHGPATSIFLQLSGARGVVNGGVSAIVAHTVSISPLLWLLLCLSHLYCGSYCVYLSFIVANTVSISPLLWLILCLYLLCCG